MKRFRFLGVWTGGRWREPAVIGVDEGGVIREIADRGEGAEAVEGWLVPGVKNDHSHAFQFAMAGLAEHLPPGHAHDDFWSWREAMYELALKVSPEQTEAIAAYLYARMLARGFTCVTEFHYFPDAAQAEAICRAAAAAGIRLRLVPVHYRTGDFGKPATARQKRFLLPDADAYLSFLETCAALARRYGQDLGAGVHSLRAVHPEEAKRIFREAPGDLPLHLHVAEQEKEVTACLAALGRRPVAWALENLEGGERRHFVHATHVDRAETEALARSGVTAVLCPTTEGNLGDGFFPLTEYLAAGGKFTIGTDSHVGVDPLEEMRWLDYVQRLRLRRRNPLCREGEDSAEVLWSRLGGRLEVGEPLDGIVLDAGDPLFDGVPAGRRLATRLYAGGARPLRGVLRRGTWVARGGVHHDETALAERYRNAVRTLRSP